MLAYTYNPITGEFVGTSSVDESPLEPGVMLMPAYSTKIAPPEFNSELQMLYFDFNKNQWSVQDIAAEPEIEKITKEQVDSLKAELKEVLEKREIVLRKLGLEEADIQLLLVKLPDEAFIDNLLGREVPHTGLPTLKLPDKFN
jgi:hypothetical protein